MPGPPPKRTEERRRRNKPEVNYKFGESKPAKPPAANKLWHPTAKRLYKALKESGQACFFEASDWAYAHFTMDQLSDSLINAEEQGAPIGAMKLAELNKMMQELLISEPSRRRARIELKKASDNAEDDTPENVVSIDKLRAMY